VGRVTRRQYRVKARHRGVKDASAGTPATRRCAQSFGAVTTKGGPAGRCTVADLLYAVLLIGVFVVLALTLRGLEKL
jgi:hypothetical protein